jgi:hypothetical protein
MPSAQVAGVAGLSLRATVQYARSARRCVSTARTRR